MHKTGIKILINSNSTVMVKPATSLLQLGDATCIHMGQGTADKQQKLRKTDVMDKNNYAEDHELILHFSECFYYINS